MTIDDAVQRLLEAGLVAKRIDEPDAYILGGSRSSVSGGIPVLDDGFVILEKDGNWLVLVEGGGSGDLEREAHTLDEAVRIACDIVGRRRTESPDR
jgi:DNA-binding transcriptional ArsR family regulator